MVAQAAIATNDNKMINARNNIMTVWSLMSVMQFNLHMNPG